MDDQNRNLILATALSFLVILVWTLAFAPEPVPDTAPRTVESQVAAGADPLAAAPPAGTGAPVAGTPNAIAPSATTDRATALAATQRVPIRTPRLTGSLSLTGARIDDLSLTEYRETIDPESPLVTLLSPASGEDAYYALHGWAPGSGLTYDDVPGAATPWQLESGDTLAPGNPVTLVWRNDGGLTFRRTISVDEDYMFTIDQTVENAGSAQVALAPYGILARHGKPDVSGMYLLHEGVVRSADGEIGEIKYDDMTEFPTDPRENAQLERIEVSTGGWIGFTDKYWMTTLIPNSGEAFTEVAKYIPGQDIYQTDLRLATVQVAPGASVQVSTRLFAGAKEWETIRHYQDDLGVPQFVDSIDWGWFYFFTKPIFRALHFLHGVIGNMGVAIILLTVLIKMLLFPLAYKSYSSMAKMKKLQPEMEKIKERAGDDKQKLQQEMMALYKKEKVNPASGCLPILVQIPIFFSLYKVIFVTIELRHAPFFGWIKDLSAPDPTSWINLFGLLPFEVPGFLAIVSIGVFPILMGITMWLQQKLNPAPPDPTQAAIFAWMPWIFMFMLGSFASGLVIYWVANNTLTFIQQYAIMRSQGAKPDILGNIFKARKKVAAKK